MTRSFTSAATVEDALVGHRRRRATRGGRNRPRRRRSAGEGAAAGRDRRDRPDRRSSRDRGVDGERCGSGTLVTHGDLVAERRCVRTRLTALADASRDRRLPRHARAGHDRRQRDERLARRWTPAARCCASARRPRFGRRRGSGRIALDELWTGPGTTSARPDELLVAIDVPAPAAGTGSCYVRLEYRRQMEIAVVGATAVVTVDGDRVTDARIAITALTPTIRRVPEAEAALTGTDGGDDGDRGAPRPPPRPPRPRSATSAGRPTTAGRWPR